MKYTIEGFSQYESIQLGLDVKDLVFLRWLLDFFNTGSMEIHMFEGRQYFWLDYRKVLIELPILGISSKDVLARRMRYIEKRGVFEFMCFEGAGNKTYFRFNETVLMGMLSDTNRQGRLFDKLGHRPTDLGGVPTQKSEGVPTQKSEGFLPKSRDHVDSSINDSSTKEIGANAHPRKFIKPTVDEVKRYCIDRKNTINAQRFCDYYECNGWKVGKGQPMKDWKSAVRLWEGNGKRDKGPDNHDNTPRKKADPDCTQCRGTGSILAPGTGKSFPCSCTKAVL